MPTKYIKVTDVTGSPISTVHARIGQEGIPPRDARVRAYTSEKRVSVTPVTFVDGIDVSYDIADVVSQPGYEGGVHVVEPSSRRPDVRGSGSDWRLARKND